MIRENPVYQVNQEVMELQVLTGLQEEMAKDLVFQEKEDFLYILFLYHFLNFNYKIFVNIGTDRCSRNFWKKWRTRANWTNRT